MSVVPEEPNEPLYIARVMSMWEESGDKCFHASWFSRGSETVLGETSDPCELFLVDSCGDTSLTAVMGKVNVQHRTYPSDWRMLGGLEEKEEIMEEGSNFFFQKWYDQDTARFEDPPMEYLDNVDNVCQSCVSNQRKVRLKE